MANARIVTDSAAELDPELAQDLGITVVPWRIRVGARTLVDGPNLRSPSFYSATISERAELTVSAPSASDLSQAYERLAQETADIVSIHPSAQFAPLVRAANQARRSFTGRCRIQVLNGQFISRALGLLVTEAARAAADGMPGPDIVRWVNGLIPFVYLAFYVDAPKELVRREVAIEMDEWSGANNFVPLLLIEEGEIVPLLRSRRRGMPIERLVEFVTEFEAVRSVVLLHTGLLEEIADLRTQLSEALPDLVFEEHVYGPVLSSFIGPDALGVVVYEAST